MWGILSFQENLPFILCSSAHGVMSETISSLLRCQVKRLNRIWPSAHYPKPVVGERRWGGQRIRQERRESQSDPRLYAQRWTEKGENNRKFQKRNHMYPPKSVEENEINDFLQFFYLFTSKIAFAPPETPQNNWKKKSLHNTICINNEEQQARKGWRVICIAVIGEAMWADNRIQGGGVNSK